MATKNLLEVIKQWPQTAKTLAPIKQPELIVPSKISDAPSNKNSLVSLLKTSTPGAVFESTWLTKIAKESLPIENLNTTWKIIEESSTKFKNSKPTSNSLVSNLIDSSKWVIWPLWKTLWQRIQRPKQTQDAIWDVLNKVWNWSISPLWAATEIWVALWWEAIWLMPVVALTDFAVNYALNATDTKKAYDWFIWLWQNKVSEILQKWFWISKDKADNYTNIWVWLTNFIAWSKWWNIQNKWWTSNIIKWATLQEVPNLALLTIWLASEWEWQKIDFQKWLWWSALSAIVWWWAIAPNIKNVNNIIPDNKTTKVNEAKLDTELSEKASPTKTTKLSPEDAKIYPDYMKNKKDWESFIEYKARTKALNLEEIEQYNTNKINKNDKPFLRERKWELVFNDDYMNSPAEFTDSKWNKVEWLIYWQDVSWKIRFLWTDWKDYKIEWNRINLIDKITKTYRDFEQYASEKWASFNDIWDASLHRWSKNMSERSKKSALNLQAEKDKKLTEKRAELQKEYNEKKESWEIQEMTRQEKLENTAKWHPDNPAVQAAKRILEKRKNKKPEVKDINFKIQDVDSTFKWLEDSDQYPLQKRNQEALEKVTKWEINQEAIKKLESWDYEIVTHVTKLDWKWPLWENQWLVYIVQDWNIQARKNKDFPWDTVWVSFRPQSEKPYTWEYVIEFIVPKSDINTYWWDKNDAYTVKNIQAEDFISIQKRDNYKPTKTTPVKQAETETTPVKQTETKSLNQQLLDLNKQKTDLEKRVKNKPVLQKVLNQVNKKIKDVEKKISERPERLQEAELFPEEITNTNTEIVNPIPVIREKLTKKRAKEIKKAIFDELAERRKIREDKIKEDEKVIQSEELKAEVNNDLIQENRRKELEELYLKTEDSKEFEDIVYNDTILSDDNKIKLLEDVQDLEVMNNGNSDITVNKEETPFNENTPTKLSEIINSDINKTENLKFSLWIVPKLLQKIPVVNNLLKSGSKWFIDIKNKLNNIIVDMNWKISWLWDTIMWNWYRKKQIVDQAIKDFWIDKLSDWSKKNSKELADTKKELDNRLKDLYWDDEAWYTVAKSHLENQYYENIYKNKDLDNLRFISNIYFYLKKFQWKDILWELPIETQNKIKELEDKVWVKYDEEWNVLNQDSQEYKMNQILWDLLEWIGLLRYKKDWYVRWVINKEVYDFMRKNKEKLWLENIPDFEDFLKRWYDVDLTTTAEIPKWMSSILKTSHNMEKFHSQDPITRMLSYLDETGQLVMNKETVDLINNARWKDNSSINKYIWNEANQFAKTILWLHDISKSWKLFWKASWWLWATTIIWNVPLIATSWLTTTTRATIPFLKNIFWLRFKNDINKAIDFLDKIWLEQKFNNNWVVSKVLWSAYSLFSWSSFDRKTKWLLTSMIVRNQLNKNWVEVKKWQDIFELYQEMLNNKSSAEANMLISALWRELWDLSDFSNMSRWQISWLDSRIFNTFKNFWRTTVSRYLSYPTQMVNEIYYTLKNDLKDSWLTNRNIQKLSFVIWDTLWVYYVSKLLVEALLPNEDEEKKKILADKLAWWNIIEKLAWYISYPLQQPGISMLSSTFNNIIKLSQDLMDNWLNKWQIDYTKISWLVRQLSLLMKDKELTMWGTYKYNNEWSDSVKDNMLKFMLWYSDGRLDYETAKKNIDKIKEEDKWLLNQIRDKIIENQDFFYSGLWENIDIVKYMLWNKDSNNEFYKFKVRSESKKNLDTLLSQVKYSENTPMNVEEWIWNAWNWFDIKYDNKDIMWFLKTNLATNKNEQKAILEMMDELWVNNDPLYKWDMNAYMKQLQTKNPALFYQIMKKIINPIIVKIDNKNNTIKDLEFTGQESSTSFVDEILVDRYENLPRISSDIANKFSELISKDSTQEDIDSFNILLESTKQLPYLWDDIRDSIATVTAKNLKDLEWISNKLDWNDNIKEMLKQAAILRGIKFRDNLNDNWNNQWQQTITGELPQQNNQQMESWNLNYQTWFQKKPDLVELLKLQSKPQQEKPLFQTTKQPTLVEILNQL